MAAPHLKVVEPQQRLSEVDLAYLAGLLDANCIFRIRELSNGTQLPMIALHGGDTTLLEVLSKATGTKITIVHRDYHRMSCAEHCEEKHQHVTSVSGRWILTGAKATVVIAALLPYLRVHRADAMKALEVGLKAPRKQATFVKMAELGWPMPSSATA